MIVTETTARKIVITEVKALDPISIYLEDLGPGKGKATITCFNDSWSYYWGAIGEKTLVEFFLKADNDYLAHKFSTGIDADIPDMDGLVKIAEKEVLAMRRRRECDRFEARELFQACPYVAEAAEVGLCDAKFMQRVFGDEWWFTACPSKVNPKYEYLCRILDAVKAALREIEAKHG